MLQCYFLGKRDPIVTLIELLKLPKEKIPTPKTISYLFEKESVLLRMLCDGVLPENEARAMLTRATSRMKSSTVVCLKHEGMNIGKVLAAGQVKSTIYCGSIGNTAVVFKLYGVDYSAGYDKELAILSNLPVHKNVVQLLHSMLLPTSSHSGALAFPRYVMSLSDHFLDCGSLSEELLKPLAFDLLSAINHLHTAGYVHCDIKPNNVMIGFDGSAMLIDLASCVKVGDDVTEHTSPYSMGLHNSKASPILDYRCLSVTLFQCRTGRLPKDLLQLVVECSTSFIARMKDLVLLCANASVHTIAEIQIFS